MRGGEGAYIRRKQHEYHLESHKVIISIIIWVKKYDENKIIFCNF